MTKKWRVSLLQNLLLYYYYATKKTDAYIYYIISSENGLRLGRGGASHLMVPIVLCSTLRLWGLVGGGETTLQ